MTEPIAEYEFGKSVLVYHPFPHQNLAERCATVLHELFHLVLASSTPFGLFQRALTVIRNSSEIVESHRDLYDEALRASMENSKRAYEASSSLYESIHVQLYSTSPDRYFLKGTTLWHRDLIGPLEHFIESVSLPLTLCAPLVDAISRAALSTDVLEHVKDHNNIETTNWALYFDVAENSPDKRYATMASRFSDGRFVSLVSSFVDEHFRSRFGTTEFSIILKKMTVDPDTLLVEHKILTGKLLALFSREFQMKIVSTRTFRIQGKRFLDSWQSVFRRLNVSGPHPRSLTIPVRDPFADYFLNRIDCLPKKSRGIILEIAFPVPKKQLTKLSQFLVTLKTPTYLHIRLVSESPILRGDFAPERHPPQDLSLFVQYTRLTDRKLQFRSPLPDNSPDYKTRSCRFDLLSEDLISFVSSLDHSSYIVTMTYKAFTFLKHSAIGLRALERFQSPTIVIALSSTLSGWLNTIDSLCVNNHDRLLHFRNLGPSDDSMDYCLLIPSGAPHIVARPTLYHVYQRLLQLRTNLKPIPDTNHFTDLFDLGTRERVHIGLIHYYEFGF